MLRVNNLVGLGARDGGGGSSHRYWRLYITSNCRSNAISISDIELREIIGGSDATGSGTASASSVLSSPTYDADKAFNGNTGDFWHSASPYSPPEWIKYDFGSGNEKDINEVVFNPRSAFPDQSAIFAEVQYSDNDTSWTTKFVVIRGQTTSITTHSFRNVDQYARLVTTANNGTWTSFSEIEIRATVSGADQTSNNNKATWNLSNAALDNPSYLLDGSTSTRSYVVFVNPSIIYIDADTAMTFAELALTSDTNGSNTSKDFTLDFSTDGTNWTNKLTVTNETAFGASETRTFT